MADLEPAAASPAAPFAKPFHWRQLEAADYRTYIANLRSVGCPEQTVRDIISADLHTRYAPRLAELERQRASHGLSARHDLERQLEALQQEETAVLAGLLETETSVQLATGPVTDGAPIPRRRCETVSLPLVFQPIDVARLNFNPGQVEAIRRLQAKFLGDIGEGQDPADPEYRARWQASQPANDDELRGMLGSQAFQDYQLSVQTPTTAAAPAEP